MARRHDAAGANTPKTSRHSRGRRASQNRSGMGRVSTHWRTGTSGNTRSTRCAAVWDIQRPPQEGQNPRPLQENGTCEASHASHRSSAKPCEPGGGDDGVA